MSIELEECEPNSGRSVYRLKFQINETALLCNSGGQWLVNDITRAMDKQIDWWLIASE